MNTSNTTLLDKFQQCEKISLNSISGWKWMLRILLLFSVSSLIITGLTMLRLGITSLLFLTSFATALMLCLLLFHLSKKIANAYIKGDMIIVNYWRKQSPKVMDIRCVRTIKTRTIFGFSITHLEFKFDGVKHQAMLLGNPTMSDNAESILRLVRTKAA